LDLHIDSASGRPARYGRREEHIPVHLRKVCRGAGNDQGSRQKRTLSGGRNHDEHRDMRQNHWRDAVVLDQSGQCDGE
jgi:hypothetical protein